MQSQLLIQAPAALGGHDASPACHSNACDAIVVRRVKGPWSNFGRWSVACTPCFPLNSVGSGVSTWLRWDYWKWPLIESHVKKGLKYDHHHHHHRRHHHHPTPKFLNPSGFAETLFTYGMGVPRLPCLLAGILLTAHVEAFQTFKDLRGWDRPGCLGPHMGLLSLRADAGGCTATCPKAFHHSSLCHNMI